MAGSLNTQHSDIIPEIRLLKLTLQLYWFSACRHLGPLYNSALTMWNEAYGKAGKTNKTVLTVGTGHPAAQLTNSKEEASQKRGT